VLPVALAEELPVNEVLELRDGVQALGIALGPVIVNALEPPLPGGDALLRQVERLPEPAPDPLLEPRALRALLEERRSRRALQERQLERLVRATGEPPLELPYLPDGVGDPVQCRNLAAELERAAARAEIAA
jgi:hypothetical protein